ncbi:MAG: winged helix-turn-helix transcriptional regulator [Methanocellales archaeon]|nr:winged helix-turn-helix transcriptional regulator [Methanocellales archaeon]
MEHELTNRIVLELLRGGCHSRELARRLDASHATVNRRLQKLLEDNVVDYTQDGKNKTYRLKDTLETKNAAVMAEHYKLGETLATYPHLRGIMQEIQKNPDIKLAVLYGSHAKNTATPESDIDVYIETQDPELKKQLEQINTRLSVKIGGWNAQNPLIQEIMKNHVLIKGVEEYYEKTRFFNKLAKEGKLRLDEQAMP